MKVLMLLAIFFLQITYKISFSASASGAETYFIRNNGQASKQNAEKSSGGSCSYDSTAMNIETHNSDTFLPGDTIYICNAITESIRLTPPSSGSTNNFLTYRGDYPGFMGSLEQDLIGTSLAYMMYIRNKQYIKIINLNFKSNQEKEDVTNRAAIWIEEYYEPTGHIEISGCTFTETVSGIFIRGDARYVDIFKCTFKNMVVNGVGTYTYYGRTDGLKPTFITVGGSRENGNTFLNIGREDSPSSGSVPGQVIGTQADDLIFSYNHVYANEPGWGTGIYLNGVDRVLVEYNYLHDLDATHRRSPITFKTDKDWINTDIIIRFNKVGPTHGGQTYTIDSGIRVGHCMDNIVIYGNLITDVVGFGINSGWGWGAEGASDGCINEDVFIYSNIVDRTSTASGLYFAGTSGSDYFKNAYITNNLFYHPVNDDTTTHWYNYGIHVEVGGDHNYRGLTIKNNVIDTPRDTADDHIGIRAIKQDDMWIDYNHHYFPGEIPAVYFKNSDCIPCAWNSSNRPDGYGDHDTAGDPMFINPEDGNFALKKDSPLINSGEKLNIDIPSFKIQGVQYDFSISTALDPDKTNWKQTIPVVQTLDQNSYGAWEKGAFVYTSSLPSPKGLMIK